MTLTLEITSMWGLLRDVAMASRRLSRMGLMDWSENLRQQSQSQESRRRSKTDTAACAIACHRPGEGYASGEIQRFTPVTLHLQTSPGDVV